MQNSDKKNLLFDRDLIAQRLNNKYIKDDFIGKLISNDIHQRLAPISRKFNNAIIIGPNPNSFPKTSATIGGEIIFEHFSTLKKLNNIALINAENLTLPHKKYDLIISFLDLQITNNVPNYLKQINAHLTPDGLMLIAAIGGNSFTELRLAWLKADEEIIGGAYSRIAPFIDVKSAGSLLQNSGFAMPMADIDHHIIRYASPLNLMQEIKNFAASNPLKQKPNQPVTKKHLSKAIENYIEIASDDDGRIRASLDILWLLGWSPDASQPKPLAPGSAKMSLTKVLSNKNK